ncbi:MAG: methylhydantoinase [Firmicutes bacterium]|nr:methylhydantoinase [Bacillota bacterium]
MTRFDPISLEIMWSRLINMVDEIWVTIYRTAFSTIIGEAQDFGCEIMDAHGNSLAHASRSMPVFNLTLPMAAKALIERFPVETLSPGDILITNDPWLCAGHLFDIAIVTPVFRAGKVVALVGSVAHTSDIGGSQDSSRVREVYEEGILIPPSKLYIAGERNELLYEIIMSNVRVSEMVWGDLLAQVSANATGARRLPEFMDEYGMEDLTDLATEIQGRAEAAMRAAIAAIPDGEYAGEAWADGMEQPLRIPVRLIVEGDEITVDWAGAPPEAPVGGINCTLSYTSAHSVYTLKCALTPSIPSNAGCYRPIKIKAPEGTLLNCRKPASVNQRTHSGWRLAPAIFSALADALPGKVQAFTGLPLGAGAYGRDSSGRPFNDHLFQGGGQGASARQDGHSALLFPTSAGNVSLEMFEARTPLLVECKELIADSGGAGEHRGGLGQRVSVRMRPNAQDAKVLLGVFPESMRVATPGLHGGQAGRLTRVVVDDRELTHGALLELGRDGSRVQIELSGGSGYGDPAARSLAAIQKDLDDGLITPEGAARDYGVTVNDGKVQR